MAWVIVGIGVGDADDRAVERVVGETHRLDERLAKVPGKILVPVAGQPSPKPARHFMLSQFPRAPTSRCCTEALLRKWAGVLRGYVDARRM